MKKKITIYKEGITATPITILSKEGEPFNREAKIQKYLGLGYTVKNLDGTKIQNKK